MTKIKPLSFVVALTVLGADIGIACAKKATKSQAPAARERNCYAEAERRYPDPTSPNTTRNRQMWVYACWQGVRP